MNASRDPANLKFTSPPAGFALLIIKAIVAASVAGMTKRLETLMAVLEVHWRSCFRIKIGKIIFKEI